MPAYEAIPVNNADYPWRARRTDTGWEGEQFYKVAHHDPVMALKYAAGLPAMDAPWDPSEKPDLTVVDIDARYICGVTQASPARTGWVLIKVSYATPTGAGTLPPPVIGKKWSEWEVQARSESVYKSIDDQVGYGAPINNGDGFSKRVGVMNLIVSKYYALTAPLDYARFNTLAKNGTINNAALTAPAIYGHGQSIALPAQTVQYIDFRAQVVSDVLLLQHRLEVGVSATIITKLKKADGSYTNTEDIAQVYPFGDLSGLW